MKNLLIIGARGWGREIFNMLPDCIGYGKDYIVKGFLDDKTDALDGMSGYPPIIDSVENYEPQDDDVFTCALGDVNWRKHYATLMLNKGGKFINVIHKTSPQGLNTVLGKGCIIADNVGISCDIIIGDFVTCQSYTTLGHDVKIGNYCGLGVRSFMGGYSSLGDCTMIQTHSVILPHMKIGSNCLVGAGSVVIKKVKDGDTVFGNPARVLKY